MSRMWTRMGALALPLALVLQAAPLRAASGEAPGTQILASRPDARLLTVEITETGKDAAAKMVLRVALSDRGGGRLEAQDEGGEVELKAVKRDDDGNSALVDLQIRHRKHQNGRVVQTSVSVTRQLQVGKPAIMTTVQRAAGGMRVVATLQ